MSNTVVEKDTFFSRNGKWLRAFIAGLMIAVAPILAADFGGLGMPTWVCTAMAAFAFVVSGVYAAMTDTVTAAVMRWVAGVAAVAGIVIVVLELVRGMGQALA